MSGHTPGPWRVDYDGDYDEMRDKHYEFPYRIQANGRTIAVFEDFEDNQDEDARLIAQAPDLLEVAKVLKRELSEAVSSDYDRSVIEWAGEIIERAEGRA